ncbi:MAG: 2-amino-4-hydroxy-6-hydroxymethyldihydropteridine diphosphokinase [Phycisphaerales bacterium]
MEKPLLNRACIATGSNIEPRAEHLQAATDALRRGVAPDGRVIAVSKWFETEALVLPGAAAGSPYLNGACVIETTLSPRELLALCLDIERRRGRDRAAEGRWGARTLDLDLVLFGDQVIHEAGLDIPHPRMLERMFVLEPLAEIAGDWVVPGTARSVAAHLNALRAAE